MQPDRPTRRDLLRGVVTVGVGGALLPTGTVAAEAAQQPAGRPFVPYSDRSFFRSSVRGAPVDQAATSRFREFMRSHPDQRDTRYPLIRGVDGNEWGTAYGLGLPGHPVWHLTGNVPAEVAVLKRRGFHAPPWLGRMFSGTADSPFVVVDRASGWSIWGANATVVGPQLIRVSDAGSFEHRSNGLDRRNRRSSSRVNYRSRGVIPDAMVIRRDLVDNGVAHASGLGHVLHLFLCETRSASGHCHPMVAMETGRYGWGAEGVRIAVSPRVDLHRRGLNPVGMVLARTLQNHGAYIGDNSGSASAFKAEQWSSHRDPWQGSRIHKGVLAGLRWDDFVVLPPGWQ